MVTAIVGLFLFIGGAGFWKLPTRAKITREPAHLLSGYKDGFIPCSSRHITERELRRKFATYHELKDGELFQDYQVSGCAIEGNTIVDGIAFRYIEQPIHILQTTWPDGKMHELGGKHSDESSIQ